MNQPLKSRYQHTQTSSHFNFWFSIYYEDANKQSIKQMNDSSFCCRCWNKISNLLFCNQIRSHHFQSIEMCRSWHLVTSVAFRINNVIPQVLFTDWLVWQGSIPQWPSRNFKCDNTHFIIIIICCVFGVSFVRVHAKQAKIVSKQTSIPFESLLNRRDKKFSQFFCSSIETTAHSVDLCSFTRLSFWLRSQKLSRWNRQKCWIIGSFQQWWICFGM